MNGDAPTNLTLVANPGAASRKYTLSKGSKPLASLHFEYENGGVICTLASGDEERQIDPQISDIKHAAGRVISILQEQGIMGGESLQAIAVPVVAPGAYFLEDHLIDDEFLEHLQSARRQAPLHIDATLEEVASLKEQFPDAPIYGISDSAFHITKPDYAWNYGIRLEDADRFDIKRFGYYGLSTASVIHTLHKHEKLPPRLVVCHLGSGASVTAVYHGKSFDTTMGYSPLEGMIMETRSGSLDLMAARALQKSLDLDDAGLEEYLNHQGGLLGISGVSSDVRALLAHEADGHHHAGLALKAYIHSALKAIGQMSAAMGGVDVLIFTGTVGERSFVIRERIVEKLHYLDFMIDGRSNKACDNPKELVCVSRLAHSRPIFVVPSNENTEIARQLLNIL
jgi:acetate kinase